MCVKREIFFVRLSHADPTKQNDIETVADGAIFADFLTRPEYAILEHPVGFHTIFLTKLVTVMLGTLDLNLSCLVRIREHLYILAHEMVDLLVLFFRSITTWFRKDGSNRLKLETLSD